MIHLVVRAPVSYQVVLARTLYEIYDHKSVAWFLKRTGESLPKESARDFGFVHHYLTETGYLKFFRALQAHSEAIVVLGGWSSPMTARTLLFAKILHRPIFIWADHPHPRKRQWIADRLRTFVLRMLARFGVNGFLACGQPTVNYLEQLGIPRNKLINFPYWIGLPAEWSPPSGCYQNENNGPLRLIAIGRHVAVKGFETAIRAVHLANRQAGKTIVELKMLGDGPERHRLEELATSQEKEATVVFCGWQNNDEVWAHLRNADALVIPSLFEPYGVVVLEALANGRPVFASDQVTAALDRDDGSGAIQFHSVGDSETLARQLKSLFDHRDELTKRSHAARAIAEQWPPGRAASILQSAIDQTVHSSRESRDYRAPSAYDDLVNNPAEAKSQR